MATDLNKLVGCCCITISPTKIVYPQRVHVDVDDPIGHPSCEGGTSTGTHFHIARKYNGEWIAADGPLRIDLGGWQAYAAEKNYQGELRMGEKVVVASPVGPRTSIIVRE